MRTDLYLQSLLCSIFILSVPRLRNLLGTKESRTFSLSGIWNEERSYDNPALPVYYDLS
jgi:hypothetical protein